MDTNPVPLVNATRQATRARHWHIVSSIVETVFRRSRHQLESDPSNEKTQKKGMARYTTTHQGHPVQPTPVLPHILQPFE